MSLKRVREQITCCWDPLSQSNIFNNNNIIFPLSLHASLTKMKDVLILAQKQLKDLWIYCM